MAPYPTTFLAPLLTLVSLYAAQISYIAITNLQQYEEKSEKAAEYLNKAAHELYKTRVTQASGAAAVSSKSCRHITSVSFTNYFECPAFTSSYSTCFG
jgi:lipocalin